MEHASKLTESALQALENVLPTLYDELNRKTLDTALDLVSKFENGEISPAQYYIGFNVLFNAVSGLASSDIVEFAFKGAGMVAKNSHPSFDNVRVFSKHGAQCMKLSHSYGTDKHLLTLYESNGDIKEAKEIGATKVDAVIDKIKSLGYFELT